MTTLAQTRDALVDWVVAVTSREPVFDMLALMGPRPSRDFASMVLRFRPNGHQFMVITEKAGPPTIPDEPLTEAACFLNELMISMNLAGGDPYTDMLLLRNSIGIQKHRDTLWDGGLGFSSMSEVRDLTEVVKDDYEQRMQADWVFHATSQIVVDVQSIETLSIINAGTPGNTFTPQAP